MRRSSGDFGAGSAAAHATAANASPNAAASTGLRPIGFATRARVVPPGRDLMRNMVATPSDCGRFGSDPNAKVGCRSRFEIRSGSEVESSPSPHGRRCGSFRLNASRVSPAAYVNPRRKLRGRVEILPSVTRRLHTARLVGTLSSIGKFRNQNLSLDHPSLPLDKPRWVGCTDPSRRSRSPCPGGFLRRKPSGSAPLWSRFACTDSKGPKHPPPTVRVTPTPLVEGTQRLPLVRADRRRPGLAVRHDGPAVVQPGPTSGHARTAGPPGGTANPDDVNFYGGIATMIS